MKYLLLLSVLLSAKSFAYPSVGDFARYETLFRGEKMVMEKSLINHSSEQNTFTQLTRIFMRGEVIQEEILEIASLWFYTEAKLLNVMNTCTRREGALGSSVVDGKTIKTCTFYNESAQLDYSVGMVPFGQVRFQLYLGDGEFLDFNLVKFEAK